jgi:two-component system, OmpR family, phosphate regulon sensor histidine kinase PhoR
VILIVASGILVEYALKTRHLYQKQTLTILTALTPPWAINIIYLFAPARLNYRDWTPVGFAATGTLFVLAFQRLRLLDLMPIARDLVVEHMQEGVLVLDDTGRVVDLNTSAERLIGIDGIIGQPAKRLFAAVVGLNPGPLVGLKDAPETDLDISEDTPHRGELITDTGQTLEWRITPLTKIREQVAGQIVLLRDVTDERATERALAEMNATLEAQVEARTAEIQAAQERSDVILQSVNDAIVMIDHDAGIQYANPAFTAITGYPNNEVVGAQLQNVVRGNFYKQFAEAQTLERVWQGEVRIQHADGRMIDIAMTITPIHDDSNKIVGYVCTGQDISRLMNLIRTRKGILDNISHQLRTPVTTLRLYTHLLRNTELSAAQARTLSVIDEQTSWLQHMIEDILEMTSLESGAAIDQWETIPAGDLISLILDRYQAQIAEKGLQLVTPDLLDSALIVKGDASRLAQALGEIVSNAIQFTPPGGRLTLSVAQDELDNRAAVTIAIADTGPGIPVDEQSRVFERFFRGRLTESGQIPGTGLGLNIAAIIVQAHGGRITLKSDDTGSTFTVWLPAAPELQTELDFWAN